MAKTFVVTGRRATTNLNNVRGDGKVFDPAIHFDAVKYERQRRQGVRAVHHDWSGSADQRRRVS